jgi:hypothetical protein
VLSTPHQDEDLALMNLSKMRDHPDKYQLPLSHEVEEVSHYSAWL